MTHLDQVRNELLEEILRRMNKDASDIRNLATAYGILTDKYLQMSGGGQ